MNTEQTITNIEVNYQPITIDDNFSLVEEQLKLKLDSLSLIVSEDDIKVAKKAATEINAISKVINRYRIDKKKEMLLPITQFEEKAKNLDALCVEARQTLLDQVKVFTDKQQEFCLEQLESELKSQYSQTKLREKFRTVDIKDLALVSSLNNNKSALAPRIVQTIMARVKIAIKQQDVNDARLLSLDSFCKHSGLIVALAPSKISSFINEPSDIVFNEKLNILIDTEIAQQKAMEEQLRQKSIDDAKKIEDLRVARMIAANKIEQPEYNTKINAPLKNNSEFQNYRAAKNTKKVYTVSFDIEVDESFESQLKMMMTKKFMDAHFKTMPQFKIYTNNGIEL